MHEPVPFVDLAKDHRDIESELLVAMTRVLRSGRFILGEELASFESEFARAFGVRHSVGVNRDCAIAFLAGGIRIPRQTDYDAGGWILVRDDQTTAANKQHLLLRAGNNAFSRLVWKDSTPTIRDRRLWC